MFARRVGVVGAGYVGLTTAACLASLGHRVVCADIDRAKVEALNRGEVTILEPELNRLVAEGLAAGRLEFVVGSRDATVGAEVLFLCLPTPMSADGTADLCMVESVVTDIRRLLAAGCVVVTKSTVPVGTAARLEQMLNRDDISVVANPEFLREGNAVQDFLHPDRIVVGSKRPAAAERVAALYARLGAPTVLTDAASAELIKYAANCFLAMKLSYINAMAELCEREGANIADVTEGMGYDRRIGQAFLAPGPGWGGSCLPKDTAALLRAAESVNFEFALLRAAIETNVRQRERIIGKVRDAVGGQLAGMHIGLLGLTFKAGTNDLRDSPALAVATLLAAEGATLTGYDPAVTGPVRGFTDTITVVDDPYLVADEAAALVLLTEWPAFRTLDWAAIAARLHGHVVIDTRNHLDPDVLCRSGLAWHGVGQPSRQPGKSQDRPWRALDHTRHGGEVECASYAGDLMG